MNHKSLQFSFAYILALLGIFHLLSIFFVQNALKGTHIHSSTYIHLCCLWFGQLVVPLTTHQVGLETLKRLYVGFGFKQPTQDYDFFINELNIIIIKALSQLCWGRQPEFCFSIPINHELNPRISYTSSNLFLQPSSVFSSVYHFPLEGHQPA